MAKLALPVDINKNRNWDSADFQYFEILAAVAKLADAQDLGSCGETLGGSSPSRRKNFNLNESRPDAQDLGSCGETLGGSSPSRRKFQFKSS